MSMTNSGKFRFDVRAAGTLFGLFMLFILIGLYNASKVPPSVPIISRSDGDMKDFEQKLALVQPGDLLVMVDSQKFSAPSVEKVVSVEEDGFAIQGVPEGSAPPTRKFAYYYAFQKTRGAVHIVSKERAEVFFLQIGAAAFISSTQ